MTWHGRIELKEQAMGELRSAYKGATFRPDVDKAAGWLLPPKSSVAEVAEQLGLCSWLQVLSHHLYNAHYQFDKAKAANAYLRAIGSVKVGVCNSRYYHAFAARMLRFVANHLTGMRQETVCYAEQLHLSFDELSPDYSGLADAITLVDSNAIAKWSFNPMGLPHFLGEINSTVFFNLSHNTDSGIRYPESIDLFVDQCIQALEKAGRELQSKQEMRA